MLLRYLKNIGIPLGFLALYYLIVFTFSLFIQNSVAVTVYADLFTACFGIYYYRCFLSNDVGLSERRHKLANHRFRGSVFVSLIALFILVWFSSQLSVLWYYNIYGDAALDARSDVLSDSATLYFILAVFIAPICEEILIRGIMFRHFGKVMPIAFAGVLSSFIFAFMHGTAVHVFSATLFGLYLALLFEIIGKLKYAVVAHCAYNLFTILFSHVPIPDILFKRDFVFFICAGTVTWLFMLYMLYCKSDDLLKK